MNTLLTVAQQNEFLSNNWDSRTFEFKWSSRGYGSTTVFNANDDKLLRVSGCGFDRRGAALGKLIEQLFSTEVEKLAKNVSSGRGKAKRVSREFYGLNIYKSGVSLDGACGFDCMQKILAAIGFEFELIHCTDSHKNTGYEIFQLKPISRDSWLLARVNEFKKGK